MLYLHSLQNDVHVNIFNKSSALIWQNNVSLQADEADKPWTLKTLASAQVLLAVS